MQSVPAVMPFPAGATALDSLRSNLACEVTDNGLCCLPLSTHYGLYRMLTTVAAGLTPVVEPAFSGPASLMDSIERHPAGYSQPQSRRQISRMNSLFPDTQAFSLYGLQGGECCACLPTENRDFFVVVNPSQRTADVGKLLEHRRDGLATWRIRVGITVKPTMPGTGSGRVDLVPLRDRACNEQAAVAA